MHRLLPFRFLLLLVLGLTVAACDSDGDDDPDALLGLWDIGATTSRVLATVNQTQQVINRSQPGQGSLAFTGAETGTLRYFSFRDGGDGYESIAVSSYNTRGDEPEYPWYNLQLTTEDGTWSMQLSVQEEDDSRFYALDSDTPLFTFENNVLTVNEATLSDGAETVTLDGSLTFATRSLPANQETEIDAYTYTEDDVRVEFAANNVLRIHDGRFTETGTWEIVGNQLRLTLDDDGGVDDTVLLSYQIAGNTLSLTEIEDGCADDEDGEEACLGYYERDFDLEPGTLTRIRYANSTTLTRATGTARPSEASAARGERAERENARPWSFRPARPMPQR